MNEQAKIKDAVIGLRALISKEGLAIGFGYILLTYFSLVEGNAQH